MALVAPHPALADVLLMNKSSPDVPPFQGGDFSEAKKRFQLAILDVDNLLERYEEIIRKVVGTMFDCISAPRASNLTCMVSIEY